MVVVRGVHQNRRDLRAGRRGVHPASGAQLLRGVRPGKVQRAVRHVRQGRTALLRRTAGRQRHRGGRVAGQRRAAHRQAPRRVPRARPVPGVQVRPSNVHVLRGLEHHRVDVRRHRRHLHRSVVYKFNG